MNGELYGTGITDASGNTAIEFLRDVAVPGDMMVTVTAPGRIPYLSSVPIVQPSGPFVVFDSYTVDDGSGNGDGTVDFGETVGVRMQMRNAGGEEVHRVLAMVETSDEYITLTKSNLTVGTIPPN
ncbi:MAG: hypothetical protein ACE5GH_04045, partial [Fidelibacterota bacterium]